MVAVDTEDTGLDDYGRRKLVGVSLLRFEPAKGLHIPLIHKARVGSALICLFLDDLAEGQSPLRCAAPVDPDCCRTPTILKKSGQNMKLRQQIIWAVGHQCRPR